MDGSIDGVARAVMRIAVIDLSLPHQLTAPSPPQPSHLMVVLHYTVAPLPIF